MGLLLSAFLWAYAFSQLPAGALDRSPGATASAQCRDWRLWSLAQFAGGLVDQYRAVLRGARGPWHVGEAPQFPTGARVVRDWFNVRGRGTATGIFNCASTLGTAIAAPLLTILMLTFGWRWMFMIMGIAGLLVASSVVRALPRPGRTCALDAAEEKILSGGGRCARAGAGG